MNVIPKSEVRLLSAVPLNNSYEHTMDFSSKEEQTNYFLAKTQHTFSDLTYVKEHNALMVPVASDGLYVCNYIMFQNPEFASKWFYGFITKKEYVNPNTTRIHFEIDPFQTWQFELRFRSSFIEREHCKRWNSDGSPVINTIDEGLNYGTEYEVVDNMQYIPYNTIFFLVIVATQTMHGGTAEVGKITPTLNGSPQPLTYYVHPFKMNGTTPTVNMDGTAIDLSPLTDVLKSLYKNKTAVNNIASLYITEYTGIPIARNGEVLTVSMSNFDHATIQDDSDSFNTLYVKNAPAYAKLEQALGNKYGGYHEVTESKLMMYPYMMTVLTDMKGNHQEIKNEYIQGNTLTISTTGSMGVSNKVAYNVKNYLMKESDILSAGEITLRNGIINNNPNDVPIITDMLSAYLQGNRNAIENQKHTILYNQASGMVGSAFNRDVKGMVDSGASGFLQMEGLMAKQKDLSTIPPQITRLGGNTAFDYGNDVKGLYIVRLQITAEYRKMLTNFFKMFGYKVNDVKVPNLRSRQHFNFIKTVGANVTGNIPAEDLAVIKQMFDNGVTIWHGDYIGNYNLANNEV